MGFITRWSQYLAARTGAAALTCLDVSLLQQGAADVGRNLARLDRRHFERACGHLRQSYPEWSPAQVERVATDSIVHLCQLAVETLYTPRVLSLDTWASRTRMANLAPAIELLNRRQPVILVTGHLGNWEVLGFLLAVLGYDVDALARPLDNPLINDWLLGIREKRGMRIITKWDATDRMLAVLERGGALGFIADQNAGDRGMFVPFFGRLASTYKSIGLLAIRQNVPIVCGYAHRIGPGFRFELGVGDIIRPEDWTGRRDPLYYVTARYNRALEQMVRMRPEQYLWMHRRWKSRPRHERQDKPVPAALRRNLEELPWMTQEQLQALV